MDVFIKAAQTVLDQIWEKCYVSDDVKTTFYTVLESKDDQEAILTHYEAHLGTIHKPGGQIFEVFLAPFPYMWTLIAITRTSAILLQK